MTTEHSKNVGDSPEAAVSQDIDDCRLKLILALCPAVIYTCRPDGDYGATFISENIREQLGYEPSEFIDFSGFWASKIHPEDKSRVFADLPRLFETGYHVHEYRFLHRDGTYRWMRDELRLLSAPDGKPIEIVGSWTDISERRAMEESLRESQARLEEAQRIARLGSWDWNILDGSTFCSAEFYRIFGLERNAFDGSYESFLATVHPEDRGLVDEAMKRAFTEGAPYVMEYRIVRPDENVRYIFSQGQVTFGKEGEPVRMAGTVLDLTDRKQIELDLEEKKNHLKRLAYHDSLTGLPNRNLFQDILAKAMVRADRNKSQVALLFIDLDSFKKFNDTLGHQTGDQLLREVANRLQTLLRKVDTLARLNGDEFVIVVEDVSEIEQVAHIAQKVLSGLEPPFFIGSQLCYVSASIGISLFPSGDDDIESLQKRADVARYAAKERGRNNFQFYSQEMDARAHELLLLENDLRRALENEQLFLHYQPQVDLSSGQIMGLEALVRWQHPDKGMIPPGDFVPLAEETGLIVPIGTWVLRTACAYARTLREAGIPPLRMSVNISMHQFKAQEFPVFVSQILNETSLEPQWLELEITESIAMENASETISRLATLKKMGVCLAIDDFGKGHSSLSHLKHLPITTLKIDKGFVGDILTDQYDFAIVEAIQALAKSLGLDVVAEGVETQEQNHLLRRLGCKSGQGFLFSRPLPPDDILCLCQLEKPFKDLF